MLIHFTCTAGKCHYFHCSCCATTKLSCLPAARACRQCTSPFTDSSRWLACPLLLNKPQKQASQSQHADKEIVVHLVGSVKGHEQQVLSHLQQHLQQKHIRLISSASAADAAFTIKFHRVKTRLPTDELTSILAASPGKCASSRKILVELFMFMQHKHFYNRLQGPHLPSCSLE